MFPKIYSFLAKEKKKKLLQQKQGTLASPSSRSLLVLVWRRQNTTASAAGKQSAKKMNNNSSFPLFACITRPQISASCLTCFSFNYHKSSLQSSPSLIWPKLTLLGALLIQCRPQRIRSQKKADKTAPSAFLTQQIKKLHLLTHVPLHDSGRKTGLGMSLAST